MKWFFLLLFFCLVFFVVVVVVGWLVCVIVVVVVCLFVCLVLFFFKKIKRKTKLKFKTYEDFAMLNNASVCRKVRTRTSYLTITCCSLLFLFSFMYKGLYYVQATFEEKERCKEMLGFLKSV